MEITIKEVKELYQREFENNEIYDIEVYEPAGYGRYYPKIFHTDNCDLIDDTQWDENTIIGMYDLMNEDEYNSSINANSDMNADFDEFFDNKNAKILVLMLGEPLNKEEEEVNVDFDSETLEEALEEYYESCIRTEHYDIDECAKCFLKENNHLNLNFEEVFAILKKIDENN